MSFLGNLFNPPQIQAPTVQSPTVNFSPPNFSGGGLNATFGNNGYTLGSSGGRNTAVGNVSSTFQQQANALGGLANQWAPGSSALRSSLMSSLQANRSQAMGNLRDNLAQRRILGSSFAQNSLANADQTYQQQTQQIMSQTYLQELSAQQSLTNQQYSAATQGYQTGLSEMNLEAGLAAQLSQGATSALVSAANTQAQLQLKASLANAQNSLTAQQYNGNQDASYAQGFGSFLGSLALAPFTGGTSLIGGLGGLMGGASSAGTGLSLTATGGLY